MQVALSAIGRTICVWLVALWALSAHVFPEWAVIALVVVTPIAAYWRASYVDREKARRRADFEAQVIAEGIRRSRDS